MLPYVPYVGLYKQEMDIDVNLNQRISCYEDRCALTGNVVTYRTHEMVWIFNETRTRNLQQITLAIYLFTKHETHSSRSIAAVVVV